LFSLYVKVAGEGRHTVVINVVFAATCTSTVKLSVYTARLPRAKKPTVKPKTVVAMDGVKKVKKTWMMQLPQRSFVGV